MCVLVVDTDVLITDTVCPNMGSRAVEDPVFVSKVLGSKVGQVGEIEKKGNEKSKGIQNVERKTT